MYAIGVRPSGVRVCLCTSLDDVRLTERPYISTSIRLWALLSLVLLARCRFLLIALKALCRLWLTERPYISTSIRLWALLSLVLVARCRFLLIVLKALCRLWLTAVSLSVLLSGHTVLQ